MQYFSIIFLEKYFCLLLLPMHCLFSSKYVQRYFENICHFVLVFQIFYFIIIFFLPRCANDFIRCFCLLVVSMVGVILKAGGQMRN